MRKIMAFLIVSLFVLTAFGISVSAGVNQGQQQQQQQAPTERGSISGLVQTAVGKEPIEGANVYYGGPGVADGRIELAYGVVTTDENGEFTILGESGEGLAPGIYGLFTLKQGYLPTIGSGAVIILHSGEHRENVVLNLLKIPTKNA